MRLLADTNIVGPAVRVLRASGHDVVYAAERPVDPGDAALLAEAVSLNRIILTKDHDIGALIHRDGERHVGVLLIDDLGSAAGETELILAVIAQYGDALAAGAFLRASSAGVRIAQG